MREVEVGGRTYRLGQLNAFEQWHLFRRVAPIMAGLGEGAVKMRNRADGGEEAGDEAMLDLLSPVVEVLSQMTDAESDYIMHKCLAKVQRKNEQGAWGPVMSHGQLLFSDEMDMATVFRLTMEMLRENRVINFSIGDLVQTSAEG